MCSSIIHPSISVKIAFVLLSTSYEPQIKRKIFLEALGIFDVDTMFSTEEINT
jgi:hypothetical protein